MFYLAHIITPELLETLKRVAVLVYSLNRRAPDEAVQLELIAEARAASAHAATSIEGNRLSLKAVKQVLESPPAAPHRSELEIINYNDARIYAAGQPFSEELILEVHRRLTAGLLPDEESGVWRRQPTVVQDRYTGDPIYSPPDHDDVPALMNALQEFIRSRPTLDPVVLAGLFHRQFTLIQPFNDGNGLTARLISIVLLRNLGLNLDLLLSFESYFKDHVNRYFRQLGVEDTHYGWKTDFTSWLEFWAGGVLAELQRLEQTLERKANPVRLGPHHQALLAWLDKYRSISDREYALLVDRAKATRTLDFKFLQQHGLIKRRGRGPATFYVKGDAN
jgi:Fic family protein